MKFTIFRVLYRRPFSALVNLALERVSALIKFIICLIGLFYCFGIGLYRLFSSFWGTRINSFQRVVISKNLSYLMFESNLLKLSLAPLSIFLTSSYYKYGILGFIFISFLIFLILFVITSQSFLKLIFSIQESVEHMEVVFNKFFSDLFTSSSSFAFGASSPSSPLLCEYPGKN